MRSGVAVSAVTATSSPVSSGVRTSGRSGFVRSMRCTSPWRFPIKATVPCQAAL